MKKTKIGDKVSVAYTGTLENGNIFGSSDESGPLVFEIGEGQFLPGFEENIIGMSVGESKTFDLPPEQAHGPSNPELIMDLQRHIFGEKDIQPGLILGMTMEKDGEQHQVPALVVSTEGQHVTVDFNNPLAGKTLTYQVLLQAILDA